MIHGNRRSWAWEVEPLRGGPEDPDPAAACTWCRMAIWVRGRNLLEHLRPGSDRVQPGIDWPAIYLGRWLVRAWPGLWERAGAPVAGPTGPLAVADALDRWVAELDLDDPQADRVLERRDGWVGSHLLAAGAGGAWLPDIGLLRDGATLHVEWRPLGGEPRMLAPPGRAEVDALDFLEASRSFVEWLATEVADRDPEFSAEARAWLHGLEQRDAALRVLRGYLLPWGVGDRPSESAMELLELDVFRPPEALLDQGAAIAPERVPAIVAFQAIAPVLAPEEAREVIERVRSAGTRQRPEPASTPLREEIRAAASVGGLGERDWEAGQRRAALTRGALGNPSDPLDPREVLDRLGIAVEELDLLDGQIQAATVWLGGRRPVVLLNRNRRRNAPWADRMTLAHELHHLLFDRQEAQPFLSFQSPWAAPGMERRANAYAAELLLPRQALVKELREALESFRPVRVSELAAIMRKYGVGRTVATWQVRNRLGLEVEEP